MVTKATGKAKEPALLNGHEKTTQMDHWFQLLLCMHQHFLYLSFMAAWSVIASLCVSVL